MGTGAPARLTRFDLRTGLPLLSSIFSTLPRAASSDKECRVQHATTSIAESLIAPLLARGSWRTPRASEPSRGHLEDSSAGQRRAPHMADVFRYERRWYDPRFHDLTGQAS